MKFRDLALFAIVVIGIIMFFQYKISKLEDKLTSAQTAYTNGFQQLSDGISAKAETKVVLPPNEWQKFFNTSANKEFQAFLNANLGPTLKREIDKIKLPAGSTTIINKSSIVLQGDTAYYRNADGVITKTAKVIPVENDSSMLVVVPQEIDVTSLSIKPDSKNPDSLLFFFSAFNKTTGDSLKVSNSISYVINKPLKKWDFGFNPFVGASYDASHGEWIMRAGITPIMYRGKRIDAKIMGASINYGLKDYNAVWIDVINLQLRK